MTTEPCPTCGMECEHTRTIEDFHGKRRVPKHSYTPIKPTCASCKHAVCEGPTGLIRCNSKTYPVHGLSLPMDFGCLHFVPNSKSQAKRIAAMKGGGE